MQQKPSEKVSSSQPFDIAATISQTLYYDEVGYIHTLHFFIQQVGSF
jgi:hypothetical protein